MRKISITEALVELKLYDKKINDAIDALRVFAVAGKKKKVTDMGTFGTVADFEKKSKAAWQKVMDLIRNRDELKSAIVQSNAATHLTVNGVDMTCAQAIEMKSSIQYKKTLLAQLKSTYTAVAAKVEQENRRVDQNIEDALTAAGAPKSAMELMEVKIVRDMRNKVNRVTNCETANIDKTVTASARQIADIEYLILSLGLEGLPEGRSPELFR